jgi:mRNA deadenylase 3'-5' endonuclease subunit Ccr4
LNLGLYAAKQMFYSSSLAPVLNSKDRKKSLQKEVKKANVKNYMASLILGAT